MAFLEIPTRNDLKSYDFQVDLEGTIYNLEFGWNQRKERWYFSISDIEDVLILGDLPLLVNQPLTDQYVDENLPPGRFIMIDESGANQNPGEFTLGTIVKLFYEEAL